MERKPQNLQNHAKFDPTFHFFLAPLGLILFIAAVYNAVKHPDAFNITLAVAGLWALIAVFKMRIYSLKVQDRVIRLEERLRMEKLLPHDLCARTGSLTESQLIGLRFASDAELPALVEKTLAGNLALKDIKQAVQNWRPDYWRV
ncbi:MAG: DUF6526 family protein [Acidobacteriia bacterium]|nr:DUF6526 family protein [Terriglobia bacterium]